MIQDFINYEKGYVVSDLLESQRNQLTHGTPILDSTSCNKVLGMNLLPTKPSVLMTESPRATSHNMYQNLLGSMINTQAILPKFWNHT